MGARFGGIGKPGDPIRGADHLISKLRCGALDTAANARALGGAQILGCLEYAGRNDVGVQVIQQGAQRIVQDERVAPRSLRIR